MANLEEEERSSIEEQHENDDYDQESHDDDSSSDHPKLVKKDLFDLEANVSPSRDRKDANWGTTLKLAFQCVGVIYGDLGTSPLYVLPSAFPNGIKEKNDVLGVLSLIIYSIVIVTLIKYVFIVLAANDNGNGGTFALYSLICRHVKASLMPNQQSEDRDVSTYALDTPTRSVKLASAIKSKLEGSRHMKYGLLFVTMLGVSMILGDGVLTPCISVLSAVGGIKEAVPTLTQDVIMWTSVVILVALFQVQRFGTNKVGNSFAPIIMLWFASISIIGIYNFFKYDPTVIKAINPLYIIQYFQRNGRDAWISLGGVVLCLTGSESLFADLGHFSVSAVRLSSCVVLVPSILLAYIGQCSYLQKNPADVTDSFFKSIPHGLFWPQFVAAVLAAIIASQGLISASFSLIQQAVALGCFPRIKVVHTSADFEGQVYVPEINTFLMIACIGVTLGFKSTVQIGNAYGIAVTFVFVITSSFLVLIMLMVWKTNVIYVIIYVLTVSVTELVYLSSTLYKFVDGGYLPLLLASIIVSIMLIWSYGYRKKYMYELEHKISVDRLTQLVSDQRVNRIEGLGLFYSQLVQGISPIFTHYISTVPALHSVLVFVSIKSLPISKVPNEERFLFQRVQPGKMIFRCVVRYGYTDSLKEQESFEVMLANQLKIFIRDDLRENVENEMELVDKAVNDGIVYLMGEAEVMAATGSTWIKKFTIDYLYNWLSRSVRQPDEVFLIPRKHLLKVGMTYDV